MIVVEVKVYRKDASESWDTARVEVEEVVCSTCGQCRVLEINPQLARKLLEGAVEKIGDKIVIDKKIHP
jgi:Pyruvate/2-oxoacid:ferredoxin oxidoreductase delta subunit